MPAAWSAKDERQYEHVKQSELEQGRSIDRAEEIAAATVNKQRRAEGRTKEQMEEKRAQAAPKKAKKTASRKTPTRRRSTRSDTGRSS